MTRPTEVELAWLAGIVDGEGTVGISRTNNKTQAHPYLRPHFQVVNTDMRIIDKTAQIIRDIVGKRVSVVVSNKGGKGCKRGYRIKVSTQWELLLLLPTLMPHLVAKREQAELAIEFCKRRHIRTERGAYWYEFKNEDEAAYSRSLELNRRGEPQSATANVIELKRSA